MKIIDRYIFRELSVGFILSISILMSAFLTQQMLRLSRISAETGISFLILIKFAPFIIPLFLVLAIPLSVLISSTLTFSRLSTDREISAMRSAGISVYRLLTPVILFSIVTFLFTIFSSITLQPIANNYIKLKSYETLKRQNNLGLEEGVFNNLFNLLVYVKKIKGSNIMDGILISDRSLKENRIITAKSGKFLNDPSAETLFLELEDGHIHFESQDMTQYQIAKFSRYYMRINTTGSIEKIKIFTEVWGLSLEELKKLIEEKRLEGNIREFRKLTLELHKKFSLPAAVLVLGILGVPIGIKTKFSSRFSGFILSIIIVFCYYVINAGFEVIAVEGIISPLMAAWSPIALSLSLVVYTTVKVSREK